MIFPMWQERLFIMKVTALTEFKLIFVLDVWLLIACSSFRIASCQHCFQLFLRAMVHVRAVLTT